MYEQKVKGISPFNKANIFYILYKHPVITCNLLQSHYQILKVEIVQKMRDYSYLLVDLDCCYENQINRILAKKEIRKEWRFRSRDSIDLQSNLRELEAPIPELRAIQLWQHNPPQFDIMEQALLRIRIENNIMAIRRVRYGMLKMCKVFLTANRTYLAAVEEEVILCTDEYLSNTDEE
jgi:hypothetical protein